VRTFKYYIIFLSIFLAASWFSFPEYFNVQYPKSLKPPLDSRVRTHFQDKIVEERPDVVLLGDSTINLGIDESLLSSLIDKEVYKIGYDGSASAVWYLITKNNITNSPYKPEYLIIFFRGTILTTPDFRTTGEYFAFIDELASPEDELLIQLAYLNQMNWTEQQAERNFPVYAERFNVRDVIDEFTKYPLAELLMGHDRAAADQAMETVFGTGKMNQAGLDAAITTAENYLYTRKNLNFDKQVRQSFLPEIIDLCKESGIRLIFVMMKTNQFPSSAEEKEGLEKYRRSLSNYLMENGLPFIDFTANEQLSSELFYDILHLKLEGQEILTHLLAEALEPILE
jgi:hypothetical protein